LTWAVASLSWQFMEQLLGIGTPVEWMGAEMADSLAKKKA
jgi:hypothetical protein